ncbi:MAG: addiction module protein [Saprospiraceae bacterium]|nr:addiction module protein [Saprospiraceae bacterium]MCF8249372.1 addiction module protein [Saprospiraceae bacterium]MCF8279026.1 addiction module protein [Bacteroidales bacterium]MCF8311501.1 addiction module protein [Saprospiraceae bacterium]MCF8439991.1 addiction module protein [Saprospiraceae bacterium]
MKITLDIQESKLAFFLELIKNFSFVKVVKTSEEGMSAAHKSIIDERLAALDANPDNMQDWDEFQTELEKMQ